MDDKAWKALAASLPEKAPETGDLRIPHEGMPDAVREDLEARGYNPVDLRFLPPSEERYELTERAALSGWISMDQGQVSILRLQGQRLGFFEKNRRRDDGQTTFGDLDALLAETASTPLAPSARSRNSPRKKRFEQPEQDLDDDKPKRSKKKGKYTGPKYRVPELGNKIKDVMQHGGLESALKAVDTFTATLKAQDDNE